MANLRDLVERVDEVAPDASTRAEHLAAGGGQAIKTAASLTRLLDPAARDPAVFFELVQEGIERGRLETEPPIRALLDDLRQLVAMAIRSVEDREDQEFRAALLQGLRRQVNRRHRYATYIYDGDRRRTVGVQKN